MSRILHDRLRNVGLLALLCVCGALSGCESSGSSAHYYSSSGYYGGPGWNDPYYYRPCCSGNVDVVPPPGYRPPSGRPPGARPPTAGQLPARPRPMPATRPARRR